MEIDIDLGLGSSPAEDGHAGACRHINCYIEPIEGGKGDRQIVAVDGFNLFSTLTDSGLIRYIFAVTETELLVVAGRRLFRVDQSGAAVYVGPITSDGMVTMARNRESPYPTVAIVTSDGAVYYYKGGVLTENADPDLPPVVSVAGMDGYLSFLASDGRHFASGLDDSDVDALSYATAESNPDPGVRNITRGRDLILLGSLSMEAWQNDGGDPYPFSRVTTRDVGCIAADSVVRVDQTIAWVANDGTVRRLDGYDCTVIGSQAVHNKIEAETNKSGLVACSWQKRGHTFYALSGTDWTYVLNLATGKWHERESYGLTRWRVAKAAQFGNKVILGDYNDGKLYELVHGAQKEASAHLVATIQSPPVHGFPYGFAHHAAWIDVVAGVETATEQGRLMLDYSDDGGHNFGVQRTFELGTAGQRLARVKTTRLGSSRSRTYRLRMSSAVRRCVLSMKVEAEKLGA